jgi:hypothetical protein
MSIRRSRIVLASYSCRARIYHHLLCRTAHKSAVLRHQSQRMPIETVLSANRMASRIRHSVMIWFFICPCREPVDSRQPASSDPFGRCQCTAVKNNMVLTAAALLAVYSAYCATTTIYRAPSRRPITLILPHFIPTVVARGGLLQECDRIRAG